MGRKIENAVLASFDVSTTSSGFAIFGDSLNTEKEDNISYNLLLSGEFKRKETEYPVISDRTDDMIVFALYKLEQFRPKYVSIEKPPYSHDPHTHAYLSEIVGAIRGWSIYNGVEYEEYNPSSWRKLVKKDEEKVPTKRKDCKKWAVKKVKDIFGIEAGDDRAEAILIGIAKLNEINNRKEMYL